MNMERVAPLQTETVISCNDQSSPPPYYINYGMTTDTSLPPSYEFTIADNNSSVSDQPPSYESLYGQVRAARDDSNGTLEFFKKLIVIFLSTVGCTICIGLLVAIPVSMIVIGAIYVSDCPRQTYIPIYLIVGGCAGILKTVLSLGQRIKNRCENRDDENARTNPFDGTLNCFIVIWFIAGNVWIYSIASDHDDKDSDSIKYCNKVLYQYAFWMTTGMYILMISTWLIFCVIGTACSTFSSNT